MGRGTISYEMKNFYMCGMVQGLSTKQRASKLDAGVTTKNATNK